VLKTIIQACFQFLYPPRCILCQTQLESHKGLCARCSVLAGTSDDTSLLTMQVAGLDVFVLGDFNAAVRDLIHKLKYQNCTVVGRLWGKAIGQKLRVGRTGKTAQEAWIVIPVPLFGARKRERGYNQCDLIALELGRVLDIKVDTQSLKRIKNTPSQTQLGREARLLNVADAFTLSKRAKLTGLSVILVDDVITTGATIGACAQVLKLGGVARVCVVAVARPELDAL